MEKSTDISAEIIEGGEGDDLIYGEIGPQYIRQVAGMTRLVLVLEMMLLLFRDRVMLRVDTGVGDDRVVVDSSFSGTLFIKNGEGNNILEFRTTVGSIIVDEDGTLVAKLTDGSEIKSEDYLTLDEDSGKYCCISERVWGCFI